MVRLVCVALFWGCASVEEPPDTDTDGQEEADDTNVEPVEPCSGSGEPGVRFGSGGRTSFIDFEDGDPLVLTENSSGAPGFWLESMIEGIDLRDPVNAVYRVQVDGGSSEDYITRIGLSCDDLEGWTKAFFPLDGAINTSALAGAEFDVTGVFATDAGEIAEGSIRLLGSPDW